MAGSPLALHQATAAELKARLELSRGDAPFLVFRVPDGTQQLLSLADHERISIGRRIESGVSLPWDTRVSRLHAELVKVGGEWIIYDDGLSSNGTWVGAARISGRRRLSDGDLIRVGATLLAFCAPSEREDLTALADDAASVARISPAQRRVLVALAEPYFEQGTLVPPSNAELSARLHLSIDGIKSHLRALFEAFDLEDVSPRQKRSTLVERAVRTGIISHRDVTSGSP